MMKPKTLIRALSWLLTFAGMIIVWCVDWRLGVAYALGSIATGLDMVTQMPELEKMCSRLLERSHVPTRR